MTGQESERPTKPQGQQLFTARLQPTRVEVRNVDSRDGHRTLCKTALDDRARQTVRCH